MMVLGYKANFNAENVREALRKHLGLGAREAHAKVLDILNMKPITLPDDFVLREDLQEANCILS